MLFIGAICAATAATAFEEGRMKASVFYAFLSLVNFASYIHSIKS
jgi:hypothetical protein